MPADAKLTRKLKYIIGILVAAGLLYISASVLVMNHLVQENNAFCAQRSVARETIRTLFEHRSDWTVEDQQLMDKNLPVTVPC